MKNVHKSNRETNRYCNFSYWLITYLYQNQYIIVTYIIIYRYNFYIYSTLNNSIDNSIDKINIRINIIFILHL